MSNIGDSHSGASRSATRGGDGSEAAGSGGSRRRRRRRRSKERQRRYWIPSLPAVVPGQGYGRWLKIGAFTLVGLSVLAFSIVGGVYLWFAASLPRTEGRIEVAALLAPVDVVRDAQGVPHVFASSERDLFVAQGYLHAQDRFAQMDGMRLLARGRLAEYAGRAALSSDIMMRAFELVAIAERSLASLTPETVASLEAYALGVNAYLTGRTAPLPPEFTLLGRKPEPWTPVDSLLWGQVMALQLAGNWRDELARAQLALKHPVETLAQLWPQWPSDATTSIQRHAQTWQGLAIDRLLALLPAPTGPEHASNAWALSGDRSITAMPLLANDPHLQLGAPGVWYLMRLASPQRTLVGATAPGVPGVVLGHNGTLAWGMTTTGADTFDVFVERVVANDPTRYVISGGVAEFATRRHAIAVKGESEAHQLTTRWTYHGLIISDFIPEAERSTRPDHVLALSSTLFVDANRTPDALHAINAATDVASFMTALEHWHAPVQNIFVADKKGAIALAVAGRLPKRRAGDGWMPQPGWTAEFDWDGMIEPATMPRRVDPADGVLFNANNRVSDSESPFISRDWDSPFRARRVAASLSAIPAHDLGTLQRIQTDVVSSFAQDFMSRIAGWNPADHEIRYYVETLREWDGAMRRNLLQPLLFNTWMRTLRRSALENLLGPELPLLGGGARDIPHLLLAIASQEGPICARVTCIDLLETTLRETVGVIQRYYSGDRGAWRWASAHAAAFRHAVFSRVPVFDRIAAFNVTTDGDNHTINRGTAGSGGAAVDFPHQHGPTLRALYDLANLDKSRFIIAPGQSGHPLSRHWGDLASRWANGRYVEIAGGKDELLRADGRLLVLAPR